MFTAQPPDVEEPFSGPQPFFYDGHDDWRFVCESLDRGFDLLSRSISHITGD